MTQGVGGVSNFMKFKMDFGLYKWKILEMILFLPKNEHGLSYAAEKQDAAKS